MFKVSRHSPGLSGARLCNPDSASASLLVERPLTGRLKFVSYTTDTAHGINKLQGFGDSTTPKR